MRAWGRCGDAPSVCGERCCMGEVVLMDARREGERDRFWLGRSVCRGGGVARVAGGGVCRAEGCVG